jgi:hypothetical protein
MGRMARDGEGWRTIARRAPSQLRTVFGRCCLWWLSGYDMPALATEVPGGVGWKLGSSGGSDGLCATSVHDSACFAALPYFCPASLL